MFKLFKKKDDCLYSYLGYNPKINVYKIGIDVLFELQDILKEKVYTQDEKIKLQQAFNEQNININVQDDLVFEIVNLNKPKTPIENYTFSAGSAVIVKNIITNFNSYHYDRKKDVEKVEIERVFETLKDKGIIMGSKSFNPEFYYKKAVDYCIKYWIPINLQYEFYDVSIHQVNELIYCILITPSLTSKNQ